MIITLLNFDLFVIVMLHLIVVVHQDFVVIDELGLFARRSKVRKLP